MGQAKAITEKQFAELQKLTRRTALHNALFQVIFDYGLRVSEVVRLNMGDIGRDFASISIRRSKGSASKTYPMTNKSKLAVKKYLQLRGTEPGALFRSCRGRYSRSAIQKIWERYRDDIGCSELGIHSLRHARAVSALDAGLDIADVQDLLGHKAIASTLIYAEMSTKRRGSYFEILE